MKKKGLLSSIDRMGVCRVEKRGGQNFEMWKVFKRGNEKKELS